jgi:hypothetical protein
MIQGLFQERTRGGVYGHSDRIVIDLALGVLLKQRRHAIGDWNAGASMAGTPRYLARRLEGLGLLWRMGEFGDSGLACIRRDGVGAAEFIDIGAIWEERRRAS